RANANNGRDCDPSWYEFRQPPIQRAASAARHLCAPMRGVYPTPTQLGWFVQHYEEWLLLVGPAVHNKGFCRGRGAVVPHKMRGFGGNQSDTARAKFL